MKQQQLSTFNCLIGLQVVLLVALIKAQDPVKITTSTIDQNVASTTTNAPSVTVAPASSSAASLISDLNKALESGTKKSSVEVGELGLAADIVGPTTTTAPPTSIIKSSSTTVATNGTIIQAAGGPLVVIAASPITTTTGKPMVTIEAGKQQDKLDKYFAPICNSIGKLTAKQLFKIQTQMKQFVEKTNGKLSVCFLQQFKIDPNLDPVSKAQLETICSAKKLANGSFETFKSCATSNWEPQLDKQLDGISASRASASASASTVITSATNGTVSSSAQDSESDEVSLIGDVVSKVLEVHKDVVRQSDIKVIDIAAPNVAAAAAALLTTSAPTLLLSETGLSSTTTAAPSPSVKPAISKVVEEIKDVSTTGKPLIDSSVGPMVSSSINSANSTKNPSGIQIEQSTTVATPSSAVTTTISGNTTSTSVVQDANVVPTTTVAPTSAPSLATKLLETTQNPTTSAPTNKKSTTTTASPIGASSTTTNKPLIDKLVKAASEIKPLETIQDMLKRQEKQKQDLDLKLKAEREKLLKQMKKKQDELDAKNAIKALQIQKTVSAGHQTSHSDARMHQIEHERQMSIDPIGHTIKHQQYEFNKQQRALKGL